MVQIVGGNPVDLLGSRPHSSRRADLKRLRSQFRDNVPELSMLVLQKAHVPLPGAAVRSLR